MVHLHKVKFDFLRTADLVVDYPTHTITTCELFGLKTKNYYRYSRKTIMVRLDKNNDLTYAWNKIS